MWEKKKRSSVSVHKKGGAWFSSSLASEGVFFFSFWSLPTSTDGTTPVIVNLIMVFFFFLLFSNLKHPQTLRSAGCALSDLYIYLSVFSIFALSRGILVACVLYCTIERDGSFLARCRVCCLRYRRRGAKLLDSWRRRRGGVCWQRTTSAPPAADAPGPYLLALRINWGGW